MLLDVLLSTADLLNYIKPEYVIKTFGVAVVIAFVFAETGLFFGFFLPGDSLLFTVGLFASLVNPDTGETFITTNIVLLIIYVFVAAVAGNFVGYYFGKYTGSSLYKRKDNFLWKRKYLDMTENFYKRNGAMAVIGGRFLPIIRTFVPILAGIIKLEYKKFVIYNLAGAFLWSTSFILLGYFLGQLVPGIGKQLEYIIVGLIAITLIPVVLTYFKEQKRAKKEEALKAAAQQREEVSA